MKEYRVYRCDFGHQWTLFKDKDDPEINSDCRCPEGGHEAITTSIDPAGDYVQIILRPAARIVDRVKQQVMFQGKYYLIITDLDRKEERVSQEIYTWEEACRLARIFENRSFDWALKLWEKKSF
jgi:hypothetical protein